MLFLLLGVPFTTLVAQSDPNTASTSTESIESIETPAESPLERETATIPERAHLPLPPTEPSSPNEGASGNPDESQLLFDDVSNEESEPPPLIGPGDIIRMLLVLGVVVAAIYGLFFMLRRWSNRQRQSSDSFQLHGSLSLSNNGSLHLVEVGNHLYLLGCGDQGVSLIAEITDESTLEQIKKISREAGGAPKRNFRQQLLNLLPSGGIKRRGSATTTTTMFSNPFQVLRAAQSRLQNLQRESNSYRKHS